jgi:hypothetical protein
VLASLPTLSGVRYARQYGVPTLPLGYRTTMTDQPLPPDVVDDGASDVLAEDEVVHVPPTTEELAGSVEPGSTYLPDVPDWDDPAAE